MKRINLEKKAISKADEGVFTVLIRERDCEPHIILYSLPTSIVCMSFGCTRLRASARYYCARKADVRRAWPCNILAT